jgi:hypothetical protein
MFQIMLGYITFIGSVIKGLFIGIYDRCWIPYVGSLWSYTAAYGL